MCVKKVDSSAFEDTVFEWRVPYSSRQKESTLQKQLQAVIFKLRPPFFKKEINIKKKSKMTSKLDENEK